MRYRDVYPEAPVLHSQALVAPSARDLLTLEYFEAAPGSMEEAVFEEHHVLVNLKDEPSRVENWRDGEHRDFVFRKHEVVVTPAGVRSGWRWHEPSRCIVVTLEPDKLERFAHTQLGILLGRDQLRDTPQFVDVELSLAAADLRDALEHESFGSDVLFEALARVFLVKLVRNYGEVAGSSEDLSALQFRAIVDLVQAHFDSTIRVADMAHAAGIRASDFSRRFKASVGTSPLKFVQRYRIERAKALLVQQGQTLTSIAMACGFSDQAHFTRVFRDEIGTTPKAYRRTARATPPTDGVNP